MTSLVLRLVALLLVSVALMLLGADLVTTLETGRFTTRSVATLWGLFDRSQPAVLYVWADRHLPLFLADWLKAVLSLWGWAVTGPLGCLLLFIFGRKAEG